MTSPIVPNSPVLSNQVSLSWDDMASGNFPDSPWRHAFRQAVTDVAAKAKEVLTESHGRIDAAVKMVLAGDVKLLEDGTARVASQSNGQTVYYVVNGECTCRDFPRAPGNFCKHRLGFGICKRACALATERLRAQDNRQATADTTQASASSAPPPAPVAAVSPTHSEAPASMNCYVDIAGYRVQVTLRTLPGEEEMQLHCRMEAYLKQFPAPEAPQHPAAAATPPSPEGWCRQHNLQMSLQRSKDSGKPGTWYSHRLADGTWCKGR